MNTRLKEIIKYKGMSQLDFASYMGWTPQYTNNLVTDGGIGIKPIIAVLEKFPEVDARWLLLGEGTMLTDCSSIVKGQLFRLLEIEQYMRVMTADELASVQNGRTEFPEETINKWKSLLHEHRKEQNRRLQEFKERQEQCRRKTTKK